MIKESDEDHQARHINCVVLNSAVGVAIKDCKERFRYRLPRKKLIYNDVYKTFCLCISRVKMSLLCEKKMYFMNPTTCHSEDLSDSTKWLFPFSDFPSKLHVNNK